MTRLGRPRIAEIPERREGESLRAYARRTGVSARTLIRRGAAKLDSATRTTEPDTTPAIVM
jgi:hypothetical protein